MNALTIIIFSWLLYTPIIMSELRTCWNCENKARCIWSDAQTTHEIALSSVEILSLQHS